MIKTGVIVSNPFQENTIVLSDSTGECIIVDAGGYTPQENAALSKYIEQTAAPRHGRQYARSCGPYARRELREGHLRRSVRDRRARCLSDRVGADSRRDLRVPGRFGAGHLHVDLQGQKEIRSAITTMRIIEDAGPYAGSHRAVQSRAETAADGRHAVPREHRPDGPGRAAITAGSCGAYSTS